MELQSLYCMRNFIIQWINVFKEFNILCLNNYIIIKYINKNNLTNTVVNHHVILFILIIFKLILLYSRDISLDKHPHNFKQVFVTKQYVPSLFFFSSYIKNHIPINTIIFQKYNWNSQFLFMAYIPQILMSKIEQIK